MNKGFIEHFSVIKDFRQEGKVQHKLMDILFIAVAATIANSDSWIEMQLFAERYETWLRKYLELPNGIPSHDTIERIFENIDGKEFAKCFIKWTQDITQKTKGTLIAIDGKTVRRSFDNNADKSAIHIVNAWTNENKLILGQVKTSDKSNEITAIPELLDLLFIKDCIITIDAMGTQKKIVEKIIEKKADYVLALKGNQGNLYEDVKLYFEDSIKNDFKDIPKEKISKYETIEKGHGRIEKRVYYLTNDIDWIEQKNDWKSFKSIGMAINEITIKDKTTKEYRFYITSLYKNIEDFAKSVRGHWGVESTHWILDIVFKEDYNRTRINNSAENLSMLRKIALNLLKLEKETKKKRSLKSKRYIASMDIEFLEKVMLNIE